MRCRVIDPNKVPRWRFASLNGAEAKLRELVAHRIPRVCFSPNLESKPLVSSSNYVLAAPLLRRAALLTTARDEQHHFYSASELEGIPLGAG